MHHALGLPDLLGRGTQDRHVDSVSTFGIANALNTVILEGIGKVSAVQLAV
jgi:hypothetical protein